MCPFDVYVPRSLPRQAGFTLIELMVVIALVTLAIVLGGRRLSGKLTRPLRNPPAVTLRNFAVQLWTSRLSTKRGCAARISLAPRQAPTPRRPHLAGSLPREHRSREVA
ncbi:prepilin-type N-terminal cleavage/methylation domain-containing protein [Achromobacter spanius]|uniref:prepilin-type N-terminal cleavage/methylation domain-containing protein n=1 Tax=Achromobacter spanius TaxID=217203 RepID=UPI000F8FAE9F|nr:prepilin-type N-terminal cleavage/methylation domain-containing protein [Achromobacter spanius]